jgi:DNA-binding HxlR family transcriptional regulator
VRPQKREPSGPVAARPPLDLVAAALRRSPMALQMLGDRWSLLILRDAFLGARRFSDFYRLTGAPSGTLAARLKTLVQQGVMYRNPVGNRLDQFEYRLTGRGLNLGDFALCIWAWEHKWGGDSGLPAGLEHRPCGNLTTPTTLCRHCGNGVTAADVRFESGPGIASRLPGRDISRLRDSNRLRVGPDVNRMFHRVIDVFGDRWSSRLLAAFFMGVRRFDDLGAATGIATNILSDRLRRLARFGIVVRSSIGGEWGYDLTPAGLDLFHAVLAVHKWSNRWAAGPSGSALALRHVTCGELLDTSVVCSSCADPLELHDLELRPSREQRRPGEKAKARRRAVGT